MNKEIRDERKTGLDFLRELSFYNFAVEQVVKIFRRRFLAYYKYTEDAEIKEIVDYVRHTKKFDVFPYVFAEEYREGFRVEVKFDESAGMYYVNDINSGGKKLYFSKQMKSEAEVAKYYAGLCMEQDECSPHKYLADNFDVEEGDYVADLGAAEGNFALSVVDRAKKLYLFECDEHWIEALKKTFEPWKDKVEIIPKYVSNINGGGYIRLDDYFGMDVPVNFIKMDIEGAECAAIEGASELISRMENIKLAVCAYHRQEDEADIRKLFDEKDYIIGHTRGYMNFCISYNYKKPYLRRGVLRITKRTHGEKGIV